MSAHLFAKLMYTKTSERIKIIASNCARTKTCDPTGTDRKKISEVGAE